MKDEAVRSPIVFTNPARCRDCAKCVRVCPVKAIRMEDGQAQVDPDRCIACGNCIRECPQQAKSFRDDTERVREFLRRGEKIAASVAPSFAAWLNPSQRRRLPSALRRLGFSLVGETASGAWHSAQTLAARCAGSDRGVLIESSCPAVVSYVERYRPELTGRLAPVESPMLCHARLLRERLGTGGRVVFFGPCIAKKAEAERPGNAGLVDAALTFAELEQWLREERIDLALLEESSFDDAPGPEARGYPLPGGCLATMALRPETGIEALAVNGFQAVSAALDALDDSGIELLEPLFCLGGCVGGPGMPDRRNIFVSRGLVRAHLRDEGRNIDSAPAPLAVRQPRFDPRPVDPDPVDEEAVRLELERTGKIDAENRLDCGACGYATCREKAVAVVRGLAEPEICLPYMRRLSESRTDRILETSPNGILILDEHLKMLSANPAFRKLFQCTDAILGRHVSYLMDAEPFERLLSRDEDMSRQTVEHPQYHLICRQIAYRLRREKQLVGIFVDVTDATRQAAQIQRLRAAATEQARELLEHQNGMAREMVKLLGENAARGEELVENLMALVAQEREPRRPAGMGDDRKGNGGIPAR